MNNKNKEFLACNEIIALFFGFCDVSVTDAY